MSCFGESGRCRSIGCQTVRHKIENKRRLDLDRWIVRESFRLVIGIIAFFRLVGAARKLHNIFSRTCYSNILPNSPPIWVILVPLESLCLGLCLEKWPSPKIWVFGIFVFSLGPRDGRDVRARNTCSFLSLPWPVDVPCLSKYTGSLLDCKIFLIRTRYLSTPVYHYP